MALRHGLSSSTTTSSGTALRAVLDQGVLDAAAGSATPDAVAKMEWVLGAAGGGSRSLRISTAREAMRVGDVGRLRWLLERGCPFFNPTSFDCTGRYGALRHAMQHACLAAVQWLVDEAGCELPAAHTADLRDAWTTWHELMEAAAKSPDAVAKWRWMQDRGAPSLLDAAEAVAHELGAAATGEDQVEVMRHLVSVIAPSRVLVVDPPNDEKVMCFSVPMAECLHKAGFPLTVQAYVWAAWYGNLALVRWLACEAGVSAVEATMFDLADMVYEWPCDTAAHNRDLLEAVQLLAAAGFNKWSPCDAELVGEAAKRGNLALVQYLLQQQPGLLLADGAAAELWEGAVEGGCEAVLEWLAGQVEGRGGSPGNHHWHGGSLYVCPAMRGDRATLEALRRLGVPWGAEDVAVRAMRAECPLPVLQWLVRQGAPAGSVEELREALEGGMRQGLYEVEAWDAWMWELAAAAVGGGAEELVQLQQQLGEWVAAWAAGSSSSSCC